MSFAPFLNSKKNNYDNFDPSVMNKKVRFANDEKKNFFCETPGCWQYEKKWDVVETESALIQAGVGTKQKTEMALVQELHPNNYAIPVANVVQRKQDEKFYYPAYFTGPGSGFGNLSVSSSIRVGDMTRSETKNFKAQKETQVLERWEFIDDRYAQASNLVMDFPRGGDTTRKPEINLSVEERLNDSREFTFQY